MVIASTWSCVTWTVVVPSRRCNAVICVRVWTRSFASRFDSGLPVAMKSSHVGHSLLADLVAVGRQGGLLEQVAAVAHRQAADVGPGAESSSRRRPS
jgi:hypothetical protein